MLGHPKKRKWISLDLNRSKTGKKEILAKHCGFISPDAVQTPKFSDASFGLFPAKLDKEYLL